ncbi:hypothetical protein NEOLEDRAFT_216095 [Neolentinus lepideus HHB14362 ss-1]|uniref:Fungal-type protein kinase domain-containing protein n=1 Tax=Neolentinus lepideus HHB14362 ss-1 TaxID=1314782 RepID=A0A165MCS0_9AGAM|nr:hypothetical protein NEOLEDRAFT_216095 [Neolentinus lepideus HHB14362 ss-1]
MGIKRWDPVECCLYSVAKQNHSDHCHAVGLEASNYLHGPVTVSEFMEASFSGWKAPSISDKQLAKYSTLLDEIVPHQTEAGGLSEKSMYEPIMKSFGAICKKQAMPLRFHICANERLPDEPEFGYRAAPDLSILSRDSPEGHWSRSLAFIEVKPMEKDDPLFHHTPGKDLDLKDSHVNVWNQIQSYAASSYRAVPRCFLLAIGIFGDTARFFRWDRSSHIVSHAFRYKTHPAPLIKFLVGLSRYAGGGVDQTLSSGIVLRQEQALVEHHCARAVDKDLLPPYESIHPGRTLIDDSTRLEVKYNGSVDVYVTLGPPIFCSRSIFGRGTRVWLARMVGCPIDKEDVDYVVIKDSWRERALWTEGDAYNAIHGDSNVFGVARILCDYDVVTDLNDKIHRTSGAHLNGVIDSWGLPRHNEPPFTDLVHHRCILLSVGIPLWRFSSTRILMEAIRDGIIGHRNMCDRGVLHRDISINNVMISADASKESNAKGFIIDPEYAVLLDSPSSDDDLCDLTGTFQFTSVARFFAGHGVKHAQWHDLESFFWVTVNVVLKHTDCSMLIDGIRVSGPVAVHLIFTDAPSTRKSFIETHAPRLDPLPLETTGGQDKGNGNKQRESYHYPYEAKSISRRNSTDAGGHRRGQHEIEFSSAHA